ncbi:hypothetical protein FRC17_000922 [Serendipita sp. 399]|nr:hypothetical protein FRC17_000922 [Serendipita sp. 399]
MSLRTYRVVVLLFILVVLLLFHIFGAKPTRLSASFHRESIWGSQMDHEAVFEDPFHKDETPLAGLNSQGVSSQRHSFKWRNITSIPETRVYAHLPGFSVLTNVFAINGTLLLVSDHQTSFPNLKYILSSWKELNSKTFVKEPTDEDIRVADRKTAMRILGISARVLRNTTWLFNDPLAYTDESFAFRALRAHYMQEHRQHFNQTILPPTRILFPHISNTARSLLPGLSSIPRLLFPSSGTGFKEDWNDYILLGRPILFEYLVILDSAANSRNPRISTNEQEAFGHLSVGSPLSVFNRISPGWWSDWRHRMAKMVGVDMYDWRGESSPSVRPVVTYISREADTEGVLDQRDHLRLVQNLNRLVDSHGYDVHVIDYRKTNFLERVRVSLRTTVMLGTPGSSLTDTIWMHPSRLSLAIEIFPEGYLSTKQYFLAKTAGVQHQAWKGSQLLSETSTPLSKVPEAYLAKLNSGTPSGSIIAPKSPIRVDAVALVNHVVAWLEQNEGTEDEEM